MIYLWECEDCGLTFERASKREPRRGCPCCGLKGAKTFVGEKCEHGFRIDRCVCPICEREKAINMAMRSLKAKLDRGIKALEEIESVNRLHVAAQGVEKSMQHIERTAKEALRFMRGKKS